MSMFDIFKKKPEPEPLIINDELGTFILTDSQNGKYYEGDIDWLGESCGVSLAFDSAEEKTAKRALEHLHKLVSDADVWDKRIREYITNDFADDNGMVQIWGSCDSDDEPADITREEFYGRLSFGFAYIYPDGEMEIDYESDEMFTDHCIMVFANISGEITGADLYG